MSAKRWAAFVVGVAALVLLVAVFAQMFLGTEVPFTLGGPVEPIPPGWTAQP